MAEAKERSCPVCAGTLEKTEDGYKCGYCGTTFDDITATREDRILSALANDKQELIANRRRLLWEAANAEYIEREDIFDYADEILKYLQGDFIACFFKATCCGNDKETRRFLYSVDVEKHYAYLRIMLDFLLKPGLFERFLTPINKLIKAFENKDNDAYSEYNALLQKRIEEAKNAVYSSEIHRQVFVAYSGKDEKEAIETTEYLEERGVSCFLALRNVPHASNAEYEERIKKALDDCDIFLFLSSINSRDNKCDALKEIRYLWNKERSGAYSAYRYEDIPTGLKKRRAEYLLNEYNGSNLAEETVKSFFHGFGEWCLDKKSVAKKIARLLIEKPAQAEPAKKPEKVEPKKAEPEKKPSKPPVGEGEERGKTSIFEEIHVHDYKEEVVPATCIARGYTLHKCACGDEYKDNFTPLSGHNFGEWTVVKKATCTEEGEEERKCTVCGDTERRAIKATGHKFSDKWVVRKRPTCEEAGEEARRCENCGETETRTINATGHSFSDWADSKDGKTETRFCKSCGKEETRDKIAKIKKSIDLSAFEYRKTDGGIEITGLKNKSRKEVVIPEGVTSIGDRAFSHCDALTSITIPKGVTSIGKDAFYDCRALTSITIPDTLTSIGDWAFAYCRALTSITIPDSVTSIRSLAFSGCSGLKSITVDANNKKYRSMNGNLYSKDGKVLIRYAVGKTEKSFDIPRSVKNIFGWAFANAENITVTIPETVTEIGWGAFSFCKNITILCETKKPFLFLPKGWDRHWHCESKNVNIKWGCKKQ